MNKLNSTRFDALCPLLLFACLLPGISQAQDAPVKADPDAARDKISMCTGCHSLPGYKASFPEVYHVPMIAGQNAAYIVSALQAYAKQERSFPTMHALASSLSEQDMADIAAYYANLRP